MRWTPIYLILSAVILSGCIAQLDPAWLEVRSVKPATDASKTVAVTEGMVFYDSIAPTRGIRFPAGVYSLEAEDADYLYFRSTAPLEFHVFKGGQLTDARNIPGGIMLAKHFSLVPGAAYIDGEKSGERMAVWKLGGEFLRIEGKFWTKNF